MTKKTMLSNPRTVAATIGAAAIASTLLANPAMAAPAQTPEKAISLSWNGTDFTSVIGESFVGMPVSVPGDTATRTLQVRNDGPADGVLTASIINVKILDPDAKDSKNDEDNFYDDLKLTWNGGESNFTTLAQTPETQIRSISLPRGAVTPVTINYEFPEEATSGNKANVAPREASFDVKLTISGETPPTPTPTLPGTDEPTAPPTDGTATPAPTPTPEPTPTLPGTDDPTPTPTEGTATPEETPTLPGTDDPTEPAKPPLAQTGAETLGAVALGLGLLGLGTFAAARARRRGQHSR